MPNSPPPLLGVTVAYKWYQSQVGLIWTLGFTTVEPTLFRMVGMDTSRPPHFDDTNFPYYKARMACHLEAVDLDVWRVTHDGMKPIKNLDKPTKSEEKNSFQC